MNMHIFLSFHVNFKHESTKTCMFPCKFLFSAYFYPHYITGSTGFRTHLHQPPRLHDEGVLQPVDDEAVDLLLCSDGRLPQLPHESSGPLSHRV